MSIQPQAPDASAGAGLAHGSGHGGFLRHLLHAAPVIAVVSVLVFFLGHWGFLRAFETAALDTWLRLKTPLPVRDVVIVGITECDYQELFGATSPLSVPLVAEILSAVRAGHPRAIGVDLDTGHASFANLSLAPGGPPVVWARSATSDGPSAESCQPEEGQHAAAPAGHEHSVLRGGPVLGNAEPPAGASAGIALLPQDADGLIRRYRRIFRTTDGPIDSLPWALVRLASRAHASAEGPDEQLVLNFAGDRHDFPRYSAQAVLAGAKGEAWGERGPLRDKIVLLGGLYRAARDEYLTPVGPMAGVELVAQAIESDLTGGGIRATNEAIMIALEILGGVLMVWLYYRLGLGRALALSLIGIPFAALCFSYASFSTVGQWASFVPTMLAVLLHQLHHHATEYRRLYLQSLPAAPRPRTAEGAAIDAGSRDRNCRRRVFLLGAGFSRHQGMPLMSDLKQEVIDFARQQADKSEAGKSVFGSLSQPEVRELIDRFEHDADLGFEEALKEWAVHQKAADDRTGSPHADAAGILRVGCARVLWQKTEIARVLLDAYLHFARRLKEGAESGQQVTIVTLNWDLVLEAALEEAGAQWSYEPAGTEVGVLKPHGSINFSTVDVIGALRLEFWRPLRTTSVRYPLALGDQFKDAFVGPDGHSYDSTWLADGRRDNRYLVQPEDPEVDGLWRPAEEAFSRCDELVVIGYSLPCYDTRARKALKHLKRSALVKVVAPDPLPYLLAFFHEGAFQPTVYATRFEDSEFAQPVRADQ